jgi:hypothetical protein
MKIMDKLLDEFLKKWIKENNTEQAVYSSYHYDAMIAFAKHYHQIKVNNIALDDVSNRRELLIAFKEYLSELTMDLDSYTDKDILDNFESNL